MSWLQFKYTILNLLHRPVWKLEYLWARYIMGDPRVLDLVGAWPTDKPGMWKIVRNWPPE